MAKETLKINKSLILNSDIICVVGPTASGKSELAVKLAKKYNGEIISADSRQIYRGMDIGSGKVEGKWLSKNKFIKPDKAVAKRGSVAVPKKIFVYKNIPHYLIDEASPSAQYSAAKFQRRARAALADILHRGKLPIICGGTGHWIDAVIYESNFPKVKPNSAIRQMLSHLTKQEMFEMLIKLDPRRAIEIDKNNPHRIIRALEIVITTGKPVPKLSTDLNQSKEDQQTFNDYKVLWLGLNPSMETLEKNIAKRLKERLKLGMIREVVNLHKPKKQGGSGLSWKRLEAFGLEYKYCALYLQDKISKQELEQSILIASRQYAKRQMTWWKRNKEIVWATTESKAIALAKKLLS